jgi:hypothetical protein
LPGPIQYRIVEPAQSWTKAEKVSRWGKAYVAGNIVAGYPRVTADNWDGGVQFSKAPDQDATGEIARGMVTDTNFIQKVISEVRVDQPFPMAPITIQSAQDAYKSVLAGVGDTLPKRDSVDERAVRQTKTGVTWGMGQTIPVAAPLKGLPKNDIGEAGNGIITDISQVGGYPDYKGQPFADVGADGIPLWWKKKYGLDPNDAGLAQKDLQGDGCTVIEKYLDGLDPRKKIDWSRPGSNVNTLSLGELRQN